MGKPALYWQMGQNPERLQILSVSLKSPEHIETRFLHSKGHWGAGRQLKGTQTCKEKDMGKEMVLGS